MCVVRREAALSAAGLTLSGCVSGYPRVFTPVMNPPPADAAGFQGDFSACAAEVGANPLVYKTHSKTKMRMVESMQAGELALVLWPFILLNPDGEEREANEALVKRNMTLCLQERGYTVSDWKLVKDAAGDSGRLVTPTRPIKPHNAAQPAPSANPAPQR